MFKQRSNFHKTILVTISLFYGISSMALESDKQQELIMNSEGGSKMYNDGDLRIVEMIENVRVTQGTLEILGDRAIFEYSAITNELNKVTVYGSPAHYQQQLDEEGNVVVGTSETILFYTNKTNTETTLQLIGGAKIESPESTMSCTSITYLAEQKIMPETVGPCVFVSSKQSN